MSGWYLDGNIAETWDVIVKYDKYDVLWTAILERDRCIFDAELEEMIHITYLPIALCIIVCGWNKGTPCQYIGGSHDTASYVVTESEGNILLDIYLDEVHWFIHSNIEEPFNVVLDTYQSLGFDSYG